MKRSELLFNLISILVDFLMLIVGGVVAFYLRFRLESLRPIIYNLTIGEYLKVLFVISPVLLLLLALAGLYNLKGTRKISSELLKIVLAISSGLLLIVVLFFFNQKVFPSRLIILLTWLLTIVLISLGRIILRAVQVRLLRQGVGLHKLVIVAPEKSVDLINEIERRKELGYRIVAQLPSTYTQDQMLSELNRVRTELGIDELLQADPMLSQDASQDLLNFCRDYGIKFNFVPNLFETATTNIAVETISGIPIIVLKRTPLEGWGRVMKRVMDVSISLISLILLSPIFLIIAILIKINSRGPVFFHQLRAAGLGEFECYKFRTMHYEMSEGTEAGDKLREELEKQNARLGPFVKIKNDPRVTSIGRFLRKTKLDEMPQLWHILVGQMSLVGPRVHMVKEVDHFRNEYKHLFVLKPGATGLTQITQASEKPELSWEEEIKLDAFYIENWSIWLDLYIIFKTFLILLGRKPKVDY
ncbi:MAG: sugar transferase [Candidatus Doudnabacteria bacterium]|nr:sugar transferase [Candidatus Doudnabacteria bacterium]